VREIGINNIIKKNNCYFIPVGGSNVLGAIGFINAAFELKKQIDEKLITPPDFIYIAIGSCGSVAGLLLGLKAAKLKSKIVAITIEPETFEDSLLFKTKQLYEQTNQFLNSLDSTFNIYEFPFDSLIINKTFCGIQYGEPLMQSDEIIKILSETENIKLDYTYTSKAMAALIDDIKKKKYSNEVILFWNSFCGQNYDEILKFVEYKKLPQVFHKFFLSY
jgi:1-aminocyclopropane-1-carboxylate deaminase/D-cysteine desulfhydrase-like pyridoxal-dependent ACC family enzyme